LDAPAQVLFEKFEILECLKKDTVSSVYLANHIFLSKKILLKTLSKKDIQDPVWLERFKREAKILAKLDHPNVIRVLDFGSNHNDYYISFEYFESANLRNALKQRALSQPEKLDLFDQLIMGLAVAHQNGIVHRDIKPENILIDDDLRLKVADFGLAITTEENLLTAKSSIVGTPAYMSPEQIRGAKLTPSSDLFSLGIVAFELFCGYNPFLGSEINTTINNILNPDYDKLGHEIDRHMPELAGVEKKLLRFEGAGQLKSAEDLLVGTGNLTGSDRTKKTKSDSRKIYYPVAGVLIIILAAFITYNLNVTDETPIVTTDTLTIMAASDLPDTGIYRTDAISQPEPHNPESQKAPPADVLPLVSGYLSVQSIPASELWINDQGYGIISEEILLKLPHGKHQLVMRHQEYPEFRQRIDISPGDTLWVGVRLDTLFGYYTCEAYPWGTVYFAGKYQGETPILKPVRYPPGQYAIVIENPDFALYQDTITISRSETTRVRINLENLTP